MVGVQVSQEHLVKLVDRQLQTGVVCQGAAPDIENQDVTLGVTDLDHDAGRGLSARVPRIAASQYRHSQLTIFELFLARDEHLGIFRRGVPTTGVMVIAFVPPTNAGTGRDMGSLFVMLILL